VAGLRPLLRSALRWHASTGDVIGRLYNVKV